MLLANVFKAITFDTQEIYMCVFNHVIVLQQNSIEHIHVSCNIFTTNFVLFDIKTFLTVSEFKLFVLSLGNPNVAH